MEEMFERLNRPMPTIEAEAPKADRTGKGNVQAKAKATPKKAPPKAEGGSGKSEKSNTPSTTSGENSASETNSEAAPSEELALPTRARQKGNRSSIIKEYGCHSRQNQE